MKTLNHQAYDHTARASAMKSPENLNDLLKPKF